MTSCQNGLTHIDINNKLDQFGFIANEVDF